MSNSSKDLGQNSPRFSPQTKQERDEAFRLLGELERESARQQALREALIQNLSQRHEPPLVVPLEEREALIAKVSQAPQPPLERRPVSPEDQRQFNQNWGAWLHPKAK
jgi:hypothetical protein